MKVGDYVRTKYGVIAKITDILENCSIDCDIDVYYENGLKDYDMPMMEIPYDIKDEYIIKSDPELIKLVQVGDYVNGKKVTAVSGTRFDEKDICCWCHENWNNIEKCLDMVRPEDIKTIVTKEQFESMQYEVK